MTEAVREKLTLLPNSPGCYIMKCRGEILYVGKAVSLKNRVSSYFHAKDQSPKVAMLVSRVDDFDILLCDTELEALIMECNLIKLHKPYYNIKLKDDKHYPYIKLDENENFPRVRIVRTLEKDGARYFGPYYGATAVRDVLNVLRKVFPIRTCQADINPEKPRRPCVQFEIGNCLAPCAGRVSKEAYGAVIADVIAFLQGKSTPIVRRLQEEMRMASEQMQFERAALLRDTIYDVEKMLENQRALSTSGEDRDIIAAAQEGLDAMAQVLRVRGGRMIGGDSFALAGAGDETKADVIANFIMQYYEDGRLVPKEILAQALPEDKETLSEALTALRGRHHPDGHGGKVRLLAPVRGDKRALVLLAEKNAMDALEKRNAKARKSYERTVGATEALASAIGLAGVPRRIEGFDISNTQGAQSVASMVVFIDGAPAYKEYRNYSIKTVVGPNDFASMAEVVGRRFTRGIAEREKRLSEGLPVDEGGFCDLPDLVLIDGGPEQLRYALRAMRGAGGNTPMFGLAERLEEIWLPDQTEPVILDRHSPALHLIQRIRDEAHRFAITRHRAKRTKQTVRSRLEEIEGIGKKRRMALLKHFSSIDALRKADVSEIAKIPGMNKTSAEAVKKWLDLGK